MKRRRCRSWVSTGPPDGEVTTGGAGSVVPCWPAVAGPGPMGVGCCTGVSGLVGPSETSSSCIFGCDNGSFRSGRRVEHPQQQASTSTQSVERMSFRLIEASLSRSILFGCWTARQPPSGIGSHEPGSEPVTDHRDNGHPPGSRWVMDAGPGKRSIRQWLCALDARPGSVEKT